MLVAKTGKALLVKQMRHAHKASFLPPQYVESKHLLAVLRLFITDSTPVN